MLECTAACMSYVCMYVLYVRVHACMNDRMYVFIHVLDVQEKYLKTTLFGLTGLMPDYALLVVGSNMGVQVRG